MDARLDRRGKARRGAWRCAGGACVTALLLTLAAAAVPRPARAQDAQSAEELQGEQEAQRAIGRSASTADLIQLLRTSPNKYIRGVAAIWLGERHAREALPALYDAMNDAEVYVQRRAAKAFASYCSCRGSDNLLELLASPRASTREVAVAVLIDLESQPRCHATETPEYDRWLDAVAPLVSDRDPNVRREAIVLVGKVDAPAVASKREALLRQATRDPDADVRFEAVRHLRGAAEDATVDALLARLQDNDYRVLRETLRALSETGSPRAREGILTLLDHTDPNWRRQAVDALVRFNDPSIAPAIARKLDDRSAIVRLAAVDGIGKLRPDDAPDLLLPALEDRDPKVRQAAAEVYVKLCPKDHVASARALATLAGDSREQVAATALDALRCIRSRENVPQLVESLGRAPNARTRTQIVDLLESTVHAYPGTSPNAWEQWLHTDGRMWMTAAQREALGLTEEAPPEEGAPTPGPAPSQEY